MIILLVLSGAAIASCLLVNIAAYRDFGAATAPARRPPTVRELFATPAFVAECAATLLAAANALLPARRSAGSGARGVVFVVLPAWLPRGALRVLRGRLHGRGWSTVCTRRFRTAAAAAEGRQLAEAIGAPAAAPVIVLALGSAGLAARAYAARVANPTLRLVTLATPHQGTRSAFASARLRPGSSYLSDLNALEAPRRSVDTVAIYSDFDAWVFPGDDAYCPGAFNIEVRGLGHASMLFSGRVADIVLENLSAAPPATSG